MTISVAPALEAEVMLISPGRDGTRQPVTIRETSDRFCSWIAVMDWRIHRI